MSKTLLTQISLTRYEEIVAGILDDSITNKWKEIEKKETTTKKEQVEERQIRAIGMLFKEGSEDLLNTVRSKEWTVLNFYTDDEKISVEVVLKRMARVIKRTER